MMTDPVDNRPDSQNEPEGSPAIAGSWTSPTHQVTGVSRETLMQLRARLQEEYSVSPLDVAQGAGYSIALVMRQALGLSCDGGNVVVFANETFSSLVTLTTLRHLTNGGCTGKIIFTCDPTRVAGELERAAAPLEKAGIQLDHISCYNDGESLAETLNQSHAVLCGLSSLDQGLDATEETLIDILNELTAPVHCVDLPCGFAGQGKRLYASSTTAIGLPLQELYKQRDYTGRLYLADGGLPRPLLESMNLWHGAYFGDQPVVPLKE